ncbi:hypothetical protein O7746_08295 [Corynebacterium pseudotuberculosis]|uniref:hypothetical protein n=1 Tax=Corynebacterium pseudotuberculosis TaxID=1719 RepID=UPI0034E25069
MSKTNLTKLLSGHTDLNTAELLATNPTGVFPLSVLSRAGAALLALSLCSATIAHAPQAVADALPLSPMGPTSNRWINPDVRSIDVNAKVKVQILKVDSHVQLGEKIQLSLRIINNSDSPIDQSSAKIVARHADAEPTVAGARTILAAAPSSYPYLAHPIPLQSKIAPGSSKDIDVSIDTGSDALGGLQLRSSGVYPILIGLHDASGNIYSTQRFLLSASATGKPASVAPEPKRLSMVLPLTAEVDIVGGETGEAPERAPLIMRSEALTEEIAHGGRLDQLLDAYLAARTLTPEISTASCLAIDPQFLDVTRRMSEGYSVAAQRPSSVSENRRLRDSWNFEDETETTIPGKGQKAATDWLAKLEKATEGTCTVAMPWANADLNAVAKTNNPWLMREALQRGAGVIKDVLGITPESNIVIPGTGYITAQAAATLGWADQKESTDGTTPPATSDISAAWEAIKAKETKSQPDEGSLKESPAKDSEASLDSIRDSIAPTTAPTAQVPVSVLVADNTVWQAPKVDRFGQLAAGIRSVSYQGSLSATLAQASPKPVTAGYGNYDIRFDYSLDSEAARMATGAAAIDAAVAENSQPTLLMMPTSIRNPRSWFDVVSTLLQEHSAVPMSLRDYVTMSQQQEEELAGRTAAATATSANGDESSSSVSSSGLVEGRYGAPYDDPTVVSDTEILRARQQSDYTDDLTRLMFNDTAIALSPYNFTAPLRQDLLRALSVNGRRSINSFDQKIARATALSNENRDALTELRSSVTLLSPGNVYTRLSPSSPLLIAAKNGLPLPVDARIRFNGPEGASIKVKDSLLIPAKGSITAQMIANLPDDDDQTNLKLWLATPTGAAISNPVTIAVQTRSGFVGQSGIALTVVLGLFALLFLRFFVKRKRRPQREVKATTSPLASPASATKQPIRRPRRRSEGSVRDGDRTSGDSNSDDSGTGLQSSQT